MSDLPEMNFKKDDDKDKKKGFLPWLRSRLGFGGRGATGGAGEALPGAANFGRAAFGASSGMGGLGGLLAGKLGLIATVAVVGAAIGASLYMRDPSGPMVNTAAFNSGKNQDNYIPAIMRQQQNQGSSLDMLRDTNKGAVSMEAYDAAGYDKDGYDKDGYDKDGYDKDGYDKDGYDKDGYNKDGYNKDGYDKDGYNKDGYDKNGLDRNGVQNPAQGAMAQEMMGKLARGNAAGGSQFGGMGGGGQFGGMGGGSQFGGMGGGSQFGGMGGSGNKLTSGAAGGKSGGVGNLGMTPKFGQVKKFQAQKPRPVFSSSKGKPPHFGSGALAQAKGIKNTQNSGIGAAGIDQKRAIGNQLWDNATPQGSMTGGAGVSDGGPGGSGGTTDTADTAADSSQSHSPITQPQTLKEDGSTDEEEKEKEAGLGGSQVDDYSLWIGLPEQAMICILLAAGLAFVGASLIKSKIPQLVAVGWLILGVAAIAAAAAVTIGVLLATTYNQPALGGIYVVGGTLAAAAVGLAALGGTGKALAIKASWLGASAAALSLISTMSARHVGLTEGIDPITPGQVYEAADKTAIDPTLHAVGGLLGGKTSDSGTPTSETSASGTSASETSASKTGQKNNPQSAASSTPVEKQAAALADNYKKLDALNAKIDAADSFRERKRLRAEAAKIRDDIEEGKKSLKELDSDNSLLADARTKSAFAADDYKTLKNKIDAEKKSVANLEQLVESSKAEADESEAGSIKWHAKKKMADDARAKLDENLVGWERELAVKKTAKDEAQTAWSAAVDVKNGVAADEAKETKKQEAKAQETAKKQAEADALKKEKEDKEEAKKKEKEDKEEAKKKKEENYKKGADHITEESFSAIGMEVVKDEEGNIVQIVPKAQAK